MLRLKSFFTLTLLGGLTVVLPIVIFVFIFQSLFGWVTTTIQPATDWLTSRAEIREAFADILVVGIILGSCFLIGLLVKTGVGRFLHQVVDRWLSRLAPGYSTIREVVAQFLGGDENASILRGRVALARIYGVGSDVKVTAIVTTEHSNGCYTVFVPTAPVPTSGMVYHLPRDCVELMPTISVEAAMRTVIACGAGSQMLIEGDITACRESGRE